MLKENHIRWDSLGEYCALVPSLELIAEKIGNAKAALLAETLDQAIGEYLGNARYPSRKVNEIDNRGSSFYLALYWAKALAAQTKDAEMQARFVPVAETLQKNETTIADELLSVQGNPVDLGGYFIPDPVKAEKVMRPSVTLNSIIDGM